MKKIKLQLSFGAVALLAACSDPLPPEKIVAERAQGRWDALVEQNFEAAYDFYTPGYREQLAADDFVGEMARRPVKWTASEVEKVECEVERRCKVMSSVRYRVPAGIPGAGSIESRSNVDEIWVQIGGEWWYAADA